MANALIRGLLMEYVPGKVAGIVHAEIDWEGFGICRHFRAIFACL